MKCEDCLPIIEEYADGELDKQSAESLVTHMRDCGECASYYEELKSEQHIYAGYERDIEVSPALWACVRARIRDEKVTERPGWFTQMRGWLFESLAAPRFSPALAALIVLITVGLTAGVMSYLHSRQSRDSRGGEVATNKESGSEQRQPVDSSGTKESPVASEPTEKKPQGGDQLAADGKGGPEKAAPATDKPRRAVAVRRPAGADPTPEQLIREAEQKYIAAINILSRDVNRRRRELAPEALARFEITIAQIDHAISETRRAVRQNPEDPIALNYMLAAYSKKVEVLREMARGD
jgi:hypothetical protein